MSRRNVGLSALHQKTHPTPERPSPTPPSGPGGPTGPSTPASQPGSVPSSSAHALAYASHGLTLRTAHRTSLETQLSVLQELVHAFARSHGPAIRAADPSFRREFARMCGAVGVDVAAIDGRPDDSPSKGRSSLFDDRDSTLLRIAIRVVDECRASRNENGGMIGVAELVRRIRAGRAIGGGMEIDENDILEAVPKLAPLAPGFELVRIPSRLDPTEPGHFRVLLRSVPRELSSDASAVLDVVQALRCAGARRVALALGWTDVSAPPALAGPDSAGGQKRSASKAHRLLGIAQSDPGLDRSYAALADLMRDGVVWVDLQAENEEQEEYWPAGFIGESADWAVRRDPSK